MSTRAIAVGAAVAAIYTVLTLLASGLDLASGLIQIRFSEALTILPALSSAAIPGLFIGCMLSGIMTGAVIYDVIFGSLATLLAALCTRLIAKRLSGVYAKIFAPIPVILLNAVIVGAIIVWAYGIGVSYPIAALGVGVGETISCYALGIPLWFAIEKTRISGLFKGA